MYALRLWSVRNARVLERAYSAFEGLLDTAAPLLQRIGYERLERPVAMVERGVKGLLFDCQMCGQCVLGSTGLACPMNCPKQLRNGPCGGVRPDGHCEVVPAMRCVWVEASEGAQRISNHAGIAQVLPAIDHSRRGRSAWLQRARELGQARADAALPVAGGQA